MEGSVNDRGTRATLDYPPLVLIENFQEGAINLSSKRATDGSSDLLRFFSLRRYMGRNLAIVTGKENGRVVFSVYVYEGKWRGQKKAKLVHKKTFSTDFKRIEPLRSIKTHQNLLDLIRATFNEPLKRQSITYPELVFLGKLNKVSIALSQARHSGQQDFLVFERLAEYLGKEIAVAISKIDGQVVFKVYAYEGKWPGIKDATYIYSRKFSADCRSLEDYQPHQKLIDIFANTVVEPKSRLKINHPEVVLLPDYRLTVIELSHKAGLGGQVDDIRIKVPTDCMGSNLAIVVSNKEDNVRFSLYKYSGEWSGVDSAEFLSERVLSSDCRRLLVSRGFHRHLQSLKPSGEAERIGHGTLVKNEPSALERFNNWLTGSNRFCQEPIGMIKYVPPPSGGSGQEEIEAVRISWDDILYGILSNLRSVRICLSSKTINILNRSSSVEHEEAEHHHASWDRIKDEFIKMRELGMMAPRVIKRIRELLKVIKLNMQKEDILELVELMKNVQFQYEFNRTLSFIISIQGYQRRILASIMEKLDKHGQINEQAQHLLDLTENILNNVDINFMICVSDSPKTIYPSLRIKTDQTRSSLNSMIYKVGRSIAEFRRQMQLLSLDTKALEQRLAEYAEKMTLSYTIE